MKHTSILSKFIVILCSSLLLSGCNFELRKGDLDTLSSYVSKDENDVILLKPDIFRLDEPANPTPVTRIQGHNLSLDNSVEIVYYVNPRNVEDSYKQGVLVWKNYRADETYTINTAEYHIENSVKQTVGTETYDAYYFNGLAAKELSQYVYAVSYVFDGSDYYYSALDRYSVLDYSLNMEDSLNETLVDGGATLGEILCQIKQYSATAQKFFGYNLNRLLTDDLYYLNLVYTVDHDYCGSLGGGFKDGYFTSKEEITVYASDLPVEHNFESITLFDSLGYLNKITNTKKENKYIKLNIDRDIDASVFYAVNRYSVIFNLNDDSGSPMSTAQKSDTFDYGHVINLNTELNIFPGYYLYSCRDWNGKTAESLESFTFNYSGGTPAQIDTTFKNTIYQFNFLANNTDVLLSYDSREFTINSIFDGQELKHSVAPTIAGGSGSFSKSIVGWTLNDAQGDLLIDGGMATNLLRNLVNVCGQESVEITFVAKYSN